MVWLKIHLYCRPVEIPVWCLVKVVWCIIWIYGKTTWRIPLKVICYWQVMGFRYDVKIEQSWWIIWCQTYGERYLYTLRERGKRTRKFSSETNTVSTIDYCRQCLVIFKAKLCSQTVCTLRYLLRKRCNLKGSLVLCPYRWPEGLK